MAGVEMRFTLSDAELERQLAALVERGGNLKRPMENIGQDMVSVSTNAFERSQSPDGIPWPPSIAADEGRRTLIDKGRRGGLMGSFSYQADEAGVVYGTNILYAAIHQFGGTIVAKKAKALRFRIGKRWLQVQKVTIPARSFIGASDRDVKRWEDILVRHLEGEAAGA